MNQYGWLKAIFMSFYSRNLYRDVAQNWGLGTFFYLFMLLAFCWAVLMFKIQPAINHNVAQMINEVTPQLPDTIKIQQGSVITPEDRPYIIQNAEKKEIIAIIDTSGKYTNLDDLKTPLLVTKDKVLYSDNNDVVKIYKLPANFSTDIVPATIKEVILKIIGWLWVFLFPAFLIASFFYRVLQSIFYAMIGKLFAALASIEISYVEIVKLAMVAITPAIVVSSILEWCDIWFNYGGIFFILSMAYLVFAIGANKNK